jgi:hypothetical protein
MLSLDLGEEAVTGNATRQLRKVPLVLRESSPTSGPGENDSRARAVEGCRKEVKA